MSRDDALQLHASAAEPSSSHHHHHHHQHDEYESSYDEDDHRRLMFGLMRSGLTPQVELALRLIEEANSNEPGSSTSRSRSTTEYSYSYDSAEEDDEEEDEEEYDEDEEEEEESQFQATTRSEEDHSPSLTSKPLHHQFRGLSLQNPTHNDDQQPRARLSGKTDDQQRPLAVGSVNPGRYVQRWLADVHREGVII